MGDKKSEDLSQSDAFRKHVFEGSRIPMIVIDAETFQYVDCNQAAVDIYQFSSREETLGKTPVDVSAPTQYDGTPSEKIAYSYVEKALEEGEVVFEWMHQRPSGEFWDAEVHLASFQLDGRALLQFTLLDITNRKRTEATLREKNALMQAQLDATFDGILVVDEHNQKTVTNKALAKIFDVPDSILNDPDDSSLLKHVVGLNKDPESFLKKVKHLYEHKKESSIDILELTNGKIIQRYTAPIWENDKYYGRLWSFIDVTENWNTERALKENEVFLNRVIQNAPSPIALLDLDFRFHLVNKAFLDQNKLEEDEVVGKRSEDVGITLDEEAVKHISEQLQTVGYVDRVEFPATIKDGTQLHLIYSARMIELKGQPMVLAQTVDYTEKKKIELELEQHRNNLEHLVDERTAELSSTVSKLHAANKELQTALEQLKKTQQQLMLSEKMASLGVLAAGVAHEINNPLNFIKGGALGIEDYLKEQEEEQNEKLHTIVKAINMGIERAETIVSSLNHYSRQNNQTRVHVDVHSIIDNSLVMLTNKLKNKVDVIKKFSKKPLTIKGNEGELHQAFLNILSNAEQSIKKKGTITVETKSRKDNIIVEIADTGSGIDPESLKKIFDPFFTTKAPGEGTGLGLSITYNIINEHKGTIKYQSQIGKGTKATVQLPLKKSSS